VNSQVIKMSDNNNAMAAYVAENPKLMGALFTLVLLLSQASTAVAGGVQPTSGP
jgi:hypothetical protein